MNDLVVAVETSLLQAKELGRQLEAQDIAVVLARPPAKACCAGGCGCGAKLQVLVKGEDVARVQAYLQGAWLEAVRREGVEPALVQLQGPEGGEPPCPACQFVGPLVEGACGDCGLQLE